MLLFKGTEQGRLRLKCDGTRADNRFRLSAKRTSPFKSAGASVQSTTGSRGVRINGSSGSNAGHIMFRGSVKSTGYPLHSQVSPSLPLPCVNVCHHISTELYCFWRGGDVSYMARFTIKLGVVSRTKTVLELMCPLFGPVSMVVGVDK